MSSVRHPYPRRCDCWDHPRTAGSQLATAAERRAGEVRVRKIYRRDCCSTRDPRRLMAALGAESRFQAGVRARELGLVQPPDRVSIGCGK
ncbi:hypothetical protein [Amycolatopsis sp. cmx-4-54]|uniref:hypothetical protein n=1 Tax=Amycolatopsis sp. cmx-4-54 TaxID=2790936 RepID=UPI003979C1FB